MPPSAQNTKPRNETMTEKLIRKAVNVPPGCKHLKGSPPPQRFKQRPTHRFFQQFYLFQTKKTRKRHEEEYWECLESR